MVHGPKRTWCTYTPLTHDGTTAIHMTHTLVHTQQSTHYEFYLVSVSFPGWSHFVWFCPTIRLQQELQHYRGMTMKALSMAHKAVSKPRYVRINPFKFKVKSRKPNQPKSLLPKKVSQNYRDQSINAIFDADASDHSEIKNN